MIKSIKKARKNGWDKFDHYNKFEMHGNAVKFISDDKCERTKGIAYVPIEAIIFDIDFAKAIWGEKKILNDLSYSCDSQDYWYGGLGGHYGAYFCGEIWQYHLQNIALEEDKIAYLNKFN